MKHNREYENLISSVGISWEYIYKNSLVRLSRVYYEAEFRELNEQFACKEGPVKKWSCFYGETGSARKKGRKGRAAELIHRIKCASWNN